MSGFKFITIKNIKIIKLLHILIIMNDKNKLSSLTSYGVIVYRINNNTKEYLMVRRKNSFGYIDFICGKYSLNNIHQVQNIINEMSIEEKNNLLTMNFEDLWYNMWGNNNAKYKNEENSSIKKFDTLKTGIKYNDEIITLIDLINKSTTNWKETEWEFPKGKKNYQEHEMNCAIREFEEETGNDIYNLHLIENLAPFEEIFMGTNNKTYKNKYFIGYMKDNINKLENYQKNEISRIEWKTLENCLESIRPYHFEKKQLIKNIDSILKKYQII